MTPDDLLTARGVTSRVRGAGHDRGHVLLLDYDNSVPYERALRDCGDLPGPTLALESSPGSYHLWNLTVRTKAETALAMLATKADPMHTSVGFRRGEWTLRIGPKDRINASAGSEDLPEEYKQPPTPMTAWVNGTERPVSWPHLAIGTEQFPWPTPSFRDDSIERCPNLIGDQFKASEYLTMVDEAKP